MPVFWFLIVIALAALWLLLSCLFKPIGKFIYRLIHDAKKNMELEDELEPSSEKSNVTNVTEEKK